MIKKLLLIVLFPLYLFAQKQEQQRIDSLLAVIPKMKEDTLKVDCLNLLSNTYQYANPDAGLVYGKKALTLAKQLGWQDGIAVAYKNIGVNYFMAMNLPLALSSYNKALTIGSNKRIRADVLSNISLVYSYESNYAKGLEYAFRALKIRESLNDSKSIANSLINIGNIYFDLDKTDTAIGYSEKAIRYIEKSKDKRGLTRILYNLGLMYSKSARQDKALLSYVRGIKISRELGDDIATANYLSAMGNIYFSQKKYKTALQYCTESMQLSKDLSTGESNIAACNGIIAGVYLEMAKDNSNDHNLLEKAKHHCKLALEIHKSLDDIEGTSYDYRQLSDIEALQGNYRSAYEDYRSAVVYKDSAFNADTKQTIKNLEDQRTIELRNKEIKINRLQLENKERQKWYFIFGSALLAIIAGLLFYQSNSRKKANRKLNVVNTDLDHANKVKTRLLSILNHDLRSPVNSFIHFIQFQKESPELLDDAAKIRIENATIASAKNLLYSMEDILLWTKDQMENFGPQPGNIAVRTLFKDTANHFSAVENVTIVFELETELEVFTDDNYLKAIIRNLTANAIDAVKESANPTIVWKAWSENDRTFLSVSDNGIGASDAQLRALYGEKEIAGIQSGLGLHIVHDLAKAIHCTIAVDSELGQGTTFILSFM